MADVARWRLVEAALDAVLGAEPGAHAAALEAACGGDAALRREVEEMLALVEDAQHFLTAPPAAAAAALLAEQAAGEMLGAGSRIGQWRLVRELGAGGSSRVFLAERADRHRAPVALKLLHGHLGAGSAARFAAERRILGALDHPNIARVLDGGVTEGGQHFLAMEYVDGEPIDRWCDARSLGTRDRIALFLAVADATAYAHAQRVVHRDLKPANILVTREGVPKLLDFGLAKLVERAASDATEAAEGAGDTTGALAARGRASHRWLTPEYAAPEQLRGEGASALADIWQLGVVLYQLLARRLPFGLREQDSRALAARILGEGAPPPSSVAPPGIGDDLRGALDAIVLRALDKDPTRRYATVRELGQALRSRE